MVETAAIEIEPAVDLTEIKLVFAKSREPLTYKISKDGSCKHTMYALKHQFRALEGKVERRNQPQI
jgi:hypothetical protein